MNRKQLAEESARIEKCGGSVLEYLRSCGCVSPWGTWFRLQKEELGRKQGEITDGKGDENMQKVTLEQKKKAVEIAAGGENPLPYLRKCGSKSPERLWYVIKQNLKKIDPEKYAMLPERVNAAKKEAPEVSVTIDAEELAATENEKLKAAAMENVEMMRKPEEKEEAVMSRDAVWREYQDFKRGEITRPVNYDGFEVTALKSPDTGFRYENDPRYGMMTWRTISGDEVSLTADEWHRLAKELPKVLLIFGI